MQAIWEHHFNYRVKSHAIKIEPKKLNSPVVKRSSIALKVKKPKYAPLDKTQISAHIRPSTFFIKPPAKALVVAAGYKQPDPALSRLRSGFD